MQMRSLLIKNFRSIDQVEIQECGEFNVLIGKNNAGKSTILSAIDFFFRVLRTGEQLTTQSPVSKAVDFYNQDVTATLCVAVTFVLDDAILKSLLSSIIEFAPQMSNAINPLRGSKYLNVTVTFAAPPKSFAYVSDIRLSDDGTPAQFSSSRLLLEVDPQSAAELYHRAFQVEVLTKDSQLLSAIPERVPRELLRRSSEARTPLRYYLREHSGDVSPALERVIDRIISEVDSSEEFTRAARSQVAKWDEEITTIHSTSLSNPITTFGGVERSIPAYISLLLGRLAHTKTLYLQERRKAIGREEAGRLLDLKMSRGGPAVMRSLQDTVSTLLGVQIDAFRSDDRPPRGEAVAEIDVDNFLVQVNGAGVREALRLVLDYELLKPEILLLEEPEIHLHPGLETSMMRYLKRISNNTQVFITTHSTNFLDTAAMSNIYLISRDSSTKIHPLDAGQAEDRLPEELGLRMSSLFLYDRLVFVEGRTDEGIIREWAATLGIEFSRANVGFVQMGGASTFAYYAAERTLSFLAKRGVKTWFLLDRDERTDHEIEKLQRRSSVNTSVKFLERREVENYLVHAGALARFITWKKKVALKAGDTPSEVTVRDTLTACAAALRDTALAKRVAKRACVPVYPSLKSLTEEQDTSERDLSERIRNEIDRMIAELQGARNSVDKIVAEQTAGLNDQWDKAYMTIVPGDLLLDAVCKEFGVRFKKDKDGQRLASLMTVEEIPDEIKAIVKEIGQVR